MGELQIKCPKCLADHTADSLMETTFYGFWNKAEEPVTCNRCHFEFTVFCDQSEYTSTTVFDMDAFCKAHSLEPSEQAPLVLVRHYLSLLIHGKIPKLVQDENDKYGLNVKWIVAHDRALEVWASVQEKLKVKP